MDPSYFPRPDRPSGRIEDMTCAVCSTQWEAWVRADDATARCPACGYANDLGRI